MTTTPAAPTTPPPTPPTMPIEAKAAPSASSTSELAQSSPPSQPSTFPLLSLPSEIIARIGLFCPHRLALPAGALNRSLRKIFSEPDAIAARALRKHSRHDIGGYCSSPIERTFAAEAAIGDVAVLKLLIPRLHHVDVRGTSELLDTPLMIAARNGRAEAVRLLLAHGADPTLSGGQALLAAADGGNADVVDAVLNAAASVASPPFPQLILDASLQRTHSVPSAARLLDAGADIHADGDKALLAAAVRDNPEMVALLLDRGADLHVNKDKVLSLAARVASRKTFSLLVERGIDPKVNDGEALASASWGGNLDIVELLLELRVVRCLPWALSEASSQAHPKVVAKLFEAGARPEWVEPEEFVVLGEKKHWDLVTSLLKTHSALQTKAICGELLRPAVQQGNIEVVKLLLELVPDLQTVKLSHLGDGARTGNVELVELLLDGYDGKSSSDTLTAALKSAAASGKAEALERLVSNGADIKSAGSDAVAAAAAAGHLSMIKRLLELGVDVNCNGESVRLAAEGGHEQVVEFLLDHIANDTVLAKDAIEVAVKRGDTRVASLLFARESSDGYRLDFKSLVEAAIPTNKWELVELILAHSGKQKNDLEAQALEQSSKDGKLDVLQGLISTPGREVSTALVEASRSGHLEAVQLLLDYKSIQGTVDLNKAADAAVKENHLHVAKLLHSRGADMSKHLLAALGAGYDMTAFVLDVGKFKPEDLSDRLLSAMSWANQNELGRFNFGLHQLLLDHGADVHLRDDILMTDHAFFGRHHVLKFVLSRGGNANARNGRALEIAVMRAGRKTVKVLLEGGADVWKNDGAALKAVLETSVDKEGTKEELRAHFEKIGVQIPAGLDEAFWTAFLRDEIGVRV